MIGSSNSSDTSTAHTDELYKEFTWYKMTNKSASKEFYNFRKSASKFHHHIVRKNIEFFLTIARSILRPRGAVW